MISMLQNKKVFSGKQSFENKQIRLQKKWRYLEKRKIIKKNCFGNVIHETCQELDGKLLYQSYPEYSGLKLKVL